MKYLTYIVWDPSPEIFNIGSWEMRWYGFLFALGFLISQQILFYIFRKEGKPERDVESMTFFMVVATILGARLGHVFFYEPEKYLSNPIDILKVWEGGLASHGAAIGILIAIYLYSNYLIRIDFGKFEVKKRKRIGQNYMWVVDRLVIVVALTGGLIRLGNFINSEIVGIKSSSDYGVVFARDAEEVILTAGNGNIEEVEARDFKNSEANAQGTIDPSIEKESIAQGSIKHPVELELIFTRGIDEAMAQKIIEDVVEPLFQQSQRLKKDLLLPGERINYTLEQNRGIMSATIIADGIPRHPAQLYESISSFLIFILLFLIWKRKKEQTPPGLIFGIFLIVLFGLRFIYEFYKENQVDFENELVLNMGQILSIPLVLAGVIILINSFRTKSENNKKPEHPFSSSLP